MTGNCHVRCGVGENSEIISKSYLSLLLVFRFIEQEVINAREANKSGKNLRTLIIADEAHLFIDAKFPIALDFFFSMSKRIRKYNGSFIPATQNIADWNANEELRSKTSAILKNSQYTFIFKLSAPDIYNCVYKVKNCTIIVKTWSDILTELKMNMHYLEEKLKVNYSKLCDKSMYTSDEIVKEQESSVAAMPKAMIG